MAKELEISFSQFKNYRLCPRRYQADVNKEHGPDTDKQKYNMAFGNIMDDIADQFYKGQLFMKLVNANALTEVYFKLRDRLLVIYNKYLKDVKVGIPGRPLTKEEMITRCEEALKRFLSGVVQNRLYGEYTNSEINLRIRIAKYGITLNGRPDLAVISRQEGRSQRIVIVDFKSRPSDSVVRDQLAWYALLWYYKFSLIPNEVGFFYFEPTKKSQLVFEPFKFGATDLQKMMAAVLVVRDQITSGAGFQAKINDQCWNCGIRQACPVSC